MKNFLKENWFKLIISLVLIVIAISIAYYFFIFLSQKEKTHIELQKQEQEKNNQQQTKIDELQNFKNEQENANKEIQKTSDAVQVSEKVSCLSFNNFRINKQTKYMEYYESTKNVSASECDLIKQKNDRTKDIIATDNKNMKIIRDFINNCEDEECIDKGTNEAGVLSVNTITKLKSVWGNSAVYNTN